MRIVFTGGGTGGHIIPNIAILRELAGHNHRFLSIGEKGGLEEKFMREEGIPFRGIHAGKLRRYFDWRNFVDFFGMPIGILQAFFLLRRFKPDVVFAKGGYVCVPVICAAFLQRIPIVLHESDVTPGLATRLGSKFADVICLSFEESQKFFRKKKRVVMTGNPVRKEITKGRKEERYRLTGFSHEYPVVLIIGGSTGALRLNRLVDEALPELLPFCQIVHITGKGKSHFLREQKNYKIFEYVDSELPHLYAIADLIVSRAGSGALFEILALKKPSLLIPLPHFASRGEQIENAAIWAKRGYAEVLPEEGLTAKKLSQHIRALLENSKKREMMMHAMEKENPLKAAPTIAKLLTSFEKD